jgi:hypothetical protein
MVVSLDDKHVCVTIYKGVVTLCREASTGPEMQQEGDIVE